MSAAELLRIVSAETPQPRTDVQAERELLSAILLAPDVIVDVEPHVAAADFHDPKHARVFAGMLALRERGVAIEPVALRLELTQHGITAEFIAELRTTSSQSIHAEQHARIIAELALTRRIGAAAGEIGRRACDPAVGAEALIEFASERMFAATARRASVDPSSLADGIDEFYKRIEAGADSTVSGLSTGLVDIDEKSGGFCPGQLVILGARPRVGKSALAMQIARHVAEKTHVLVFSLEMNRLELVERLLANEGRLDHRNIRLLKIDKSQMDELAKAAERVYSLPLDLDTTPALPIGEIRSRSRRYARRHPLGMIVVDYLQLVVGPRSESREQSVAAVSRGLKALAKELNVPVLALAQLNRAGKDKPTLETLRESGGIEADADIVMLLHRDELVNQNSQRRGVADVIFAKQRSAASGVEVQLRFHGSCVRFDNMATESLEPDDPTTSYDPYGSAA